MVKASIRSKRTAGNLTSSSHNSKEPQVNQAFGIVRVSQLTMAGATQSFHRKALENAPSPHIGFPTNLQPVSRRIFKNMHFEVQTLFSAKGIPTVFANDYGRKSTCF